MDKRMNSPNPSGTPVRDAVTEARALAQEQVSAAWQMYADRIRELLDSGWRVDLDRIFEERFSEIQQRLEREVTAASGRAVDEFRRGELVRARESAAREATELLHQTARRMRQAESREVWMRAFLERASDFCSRAALFAIRGRTVRYEGGLGIDDSSTETGGEVQLASAPAFGAAVESRDTVVSVGSAKEVSEPIARLLKPGDRKVYLFPFSLRGQVVGILYAEPGDTPVNISGLELLTALAETTIEPQAVAQRTSDGLIRLAAPDTAADVTGAAWAAMPAAVQEAHARAERFARTRVAQIMLYKMEQVRSGRTGRDLYATLREEIDAGREAYREQFLSGGPSVPDYFHTELVRTLAKDDAGMLGADYPGPLT
jgi:hypothetical protein